MHDGANGSGGKIDPAQNAHTYGVIKDEMCIV